MRKFPRQCSEIWDYPPPFRGGTTPLVGDETRLGSQLAGYVIESLVGRGGMGVVYLAQDLRLNRRVALKILAPEISRDEHFRTRFVRESRIAAGIEHPNIIPIYEAGEADGDLFIAMRYVGGTDLEELIKRGGPLERGRASRIVEQTARGLDAAHQSGLVHRDVKPANILLAPRGGDETDDHVYVSDFGITKRLDTQGTAPSTGKVLGSLDFVAPEQIEGAPVDRRADVYSLGCVLYQSLTGTVPFPRETEMAVLWAHVHDDPPKITTLRPDLPPEIDAVVGRAMAKKPTDRFDTAGRLSDVAGRVLGGAAERVTMVRRPRRLRRRGLLAGAGLLLAAAGGVAILFLSRPSRSPSPSSSPSVPIQATSSPSSSPRVPIQATSVATLRPIQHARAEFATARMSAPADVSRIAVIEGAVWGLRRSGVVAEDLESGEQRTILTIPTTTDIEAGSGAVYVTAKTRTGGEIIRIEPSTGEPVWDTSLPASADAVAVGPSALWVLSEDPGRVTHIEPKRGDIVATVPVGLGANGIAINGSVWVINNRDGTLRKIVPRTNTAEPVIPLAAGANAVAAGKDAVWVLDASQRTVYAFDPQAGTPAGNPIFVENGPTDLIDGAQRAWVASGRGIWRIDPITHEATLIRTSAPVVSAAVDRTVRPLDTVPDIWVLLAHGRS
jgi:serine/threonine protein kinase